MSVTIRQLNLQDAPIVQRLVSALFHELRGDTGDTPKQIDLAVVENVIGNTRQVSGFLMFEAEEPVGVIMLSEGMSLYADGHYGLITELYITPDKRSGGLAKQLIDTATAHGRERGWSMLEVGAPSQPKWLSSYAFYIKEGFHEIGPRLRKRL